MKKSNVRCAFTRSIGSVMILAAICVSILSSCEAEETLRATRLPIDPTPEDTTNVIKEMYYKSERTLAATATPTDTLVKSDVEFKQKATLLNEKDNLYLEFTPTTYLYARLSKERIEIASTNDLPVTLTKSYIQSQQPYKDQTTLGEDVIKVFEFSDGQTATVYYGHRYNGIISGTDTLATPHMEVTPVVFTKDLTENFGEKTEVEDPYKKTLVFDATYTSKGVSGQEVTNNVLLRPWYKKIVTSDPTRVIKVEYNGGYLGCPYTAYELVEKVTTNKGEFSNTYKLDLSIKVVGPEPRQQPTMDSQFKSQSTGVLKENVFSEFKNADGFTVRTMNGTYTSTNIGTEKQTSVESTVNFTYEVPVKFESEYGSYTIPSYKLQFSELGFQVSKQSETDNEIVYKSTNTVYARLNDCAFDPIDEIVTLRMQKEKPQDVVKVDSIYTIGGEGDEYEIEKKIIWSDGSTTISKYSYTGHHEATAIDFGEVITSSLSWNAANLTKGTQNRKTEEKNFSPITKFTAVYTTTNWKSAATNGKESGTFAFTETTPVVTFVDGLTTKVFPERKYVITGLGAKLSSTYTNVVRNGVSYKAYEYDYTTNAVWNQSENNNLVSNGLLLILADVAGSPTYTPSQSWNGNTTTVKVTKTTPHSAAEDEIEVFTYDFTVVLGALTDGKVYAENTSFATTESHTGTNSTATDGKWTIKTYTTNYTYVVSNGTIKRSMPSTVKDAEITFKDGSYSHTFNVRLTMSKSEAFSSSRTEGEYTVTPHKLTAKGTTVDGKSFTTTGTTDIYVKRQATVTGHSEKTVVYSDGTVDAILTKNMSDGTTQTIKASDTFGSRFAFNFQNATAVEKVVDNVNHSASGNTGSATTRAHNQGSWNVTEYRYPYNHVLSNGRAADNVNGSYAYSNYKFVYTDSDLGTVNFPLPTVGMTHKSLDISQSGTSSEYTNYAAKVVVNGQASASEGTYSQDLTVTHTLKIQAAVEEPNLGKPKNFVVTATFDPNGKVTRRAFVFNWEDGVTYAVCDYDVMLPTQSEFAFKVDSYDGYNSVGYNKSSSEPWQPARGVDSSDAIRWYNSSGTTISAIDKALTCKAIGWRNIVDNNYALVIPGYKYTINGYYITVTAPNGEMVTFNSHHN